MFWPTSHLLYVGGSTYWASVGLPQNFEPKISMMIYVPCNLWHRGTFFNVYPSFIVEIILFTTNRLIGLVGRVFANGPGDRGSVPGWVISKT